MAKAEIIQNIKEIFKPKKSGRISIYAQPDPADDPEFINQVESDESNDLDIIALSKDDATGIFESLSLVKLKE